MVSTHLVWVGRVAIAVRPNIFLRVAGRGAAVLIIIIMVHLRMQPEGYGAAIYAFELQSLIASSSPQFLLLRCCEVLLFCRLVSVLLSPSDGCFLVSNGLRGKASCRKERRGK